MSTQANKDRSTLMSVLCLALFLSFYFFHILIYWKYTNDDAYITFRYSRYLALGRGPFFNPGEFVEGYTNFSWMLISALVIKLFGAAQAPFVIKGLCVFFGAVSIMLAFGITRHIARQSEALRSISHLLGLVVAGLLCLHPGFCVNATSGLETMFFAFCLSGGVLLLLLEMDQKRWRGSVLLFGLAVLTRPEGIYIYTAIWLSSAAALLFAWRQDNQETPQDTQRQTWQWLWQDVGKLWFIQGVLVSAVFFGHITLRMSLYQGEWLPNTYYAKAGGFWKFGAWAYISQAIQPVTFGAWGLLLAGLGWLLQLPHMRHPWLLTGIALAMGTLPFITGADWMIGWRLMVPFLPFLLSAVLLGWTFLVMPLLKEQSRWIVLVVFLAIPFAWYAYQPIRSLFLDEIVVRYDGYKTGHRALAKWLCQSPPKQHPHTATQGDAITLMDIGIISYYCIDQTVIDLTGLTDRSIAKSPGKFLRKVYDPSYILKRNPRFVVLVLTAKGASYQTPFPGTTFRFWTRIEERLFRHPGFQTRYIRTPPKATYKETMTSRTPKKDPWIGTFTKQIGAIKIFEHAHLGRHYLLVLFKRIDKQNQPNKR